MLKSLFKILLISKGTLPTLFVFEDVKTVTKSLPLRKKVTNLLFFGFSTSTFRGSSVFVLKYQVDKVLKCGVCWSVCDWDEFFVEDE